MGMDVEAYRPWWRLEGSLDRAARQRIETLLSEHRFWDAYDLSREHGIELEAYQLELERGDIYSGEFFFLAELYVVHGQHGPARPPLLARFLRREREESAVFLPEELTTLAEELAFARQLGERIYSPHLDLVAAHPAFVDRWLIRGNPHFDLGSEPAPDPWCLFAEGEEMIFYSGKWRFGDPWDESRAVRLQNPQWNGKRFAYVETRDGVEGEREFGFPHVREEIRQLEEGDWTFDPELECYVDPPRKTAAIPSHPLWDGPAELAWKPALEAMAETLERIEKAVSLASEVDGLVVL